MSALRVMVVDDSALTVRKLSAMLKELGHEVVQTCDTGEQAVNAFGEHRPDLVTMDITMPDMDGIEATRRIMARHPEALIIMVTSHGQEQMVMDAIEAGAQGYVLKPFQKEKLSDAIGQVMQRQQAS